MIRPLIAGLLVTIAAPSGAFAQACTGNPLAVQILGSGAPGFVKDRANTSYLLWIGPQAKILVDAGGGSYVRFGQAQAKFSDLSMILVSHLHPDHVSDLPGILWSGRMTRSDSLPVIGPSGNDAVPSFSAFLERQFDPKSGAFEVLGSTMAKAPGNPGVRLDAEIVDVMKQEPTTVFDRDGVKVTALGIPSNLGLPRGNARPLGRIQLRSKRNQSEISRIREGRESPGHAPGDRRRRQQSQPGLARRGGQRRAERKPPTAGSQPHRPIRPRCGRRGREAELPGPAHGGRRFAVHAGAVGPAFLANSGYRCRP